MFLKISALALLTFCALVGKSHAQDGCLALPVQNLTVNSFAILTWSVNYYEVCEITEYLVNIWEPEDPQEYTFSVVDPRVEVSFLKPCHDYTIVVTPISEHTKGHSQFLYTKIPILIGSDLSLAYLNYTYNETTSQSHLHWAMSDPDFRYCELTYRVTVEEEGNAIIDDYYVTDTFLDLYFLAPCSLYQFGVRAINIGSPTIEGPLKFSMIGIPGSVQTPPTLVEVEAGARYANLSFRLNSKVRNPCEVTQFYIDGGSFFERNISIVDLEFFRRPVNVSITALRPNSMYFLQAFVKNSEGWSRPTVAAIQTLEDSTLVKISEPEH